jgi:hypothetical protein
MAQLQYRPDHIPQGCENGWVAAFETGRAEVLAGKRQPAAFPSLHCCEIAFDENVEREPSFGIGLLPNEKIGQRLARFRQINISCDPSRCA